MTRLRLEGIPRFAVYIALQVAVFSMRFPWLAIPALVLALIGQTEGFQWVRWLVRSRAVVIVALLPALAGFPWGVEAGLWHAWEPSLLHSVRLGLVLASATWLSSRMSYIELRDVLETILRPLGQRTSSRIARAASLTMAFIPWIMQELRTADEAARLRGSDTRRRPGRHLASAAVPLVARSLEKAKLAAEALSLRDPFFGA
jgi:energy-coupling factor transporter transmembrane protein EcfT